PNIGNASRPTGCSRQCRSSWRRRPAPEGALTGPNAQITGDRRVAGRGSNEASPIRGMGPSPSSGSDQLIRSTGPSGMTIAQAKHRTLVDAKHRGPSRRPPADRPGDADQDRAPEPGVPGGGQLRPPLLGTEPDCPAP